MKITTPTVAVIDHRAGRVTLDGVDIAPGTAIAADPTVEVLDRSLARITVGLYAENVLIVTDRGASSPTAAAEARAIVRSGLRDVLDWLGEGDSPGRAAAKKLRDALDRERAKVASTMARPAVDQPDDDDAEWDAREAIERARGGR